MALNDALRFEVQGFGIDVILIEPGLIGSGFADVASRASIASNIVAAHAHFTREVGRIGELRRASQAADRLARGRRDRRPRGADDGAPEDAGIASALGALPCARSSAIAVGPFHAPRMLTPH